MRSHARLTGFGSKSVLYGEGANIAGSSGAASAISRFENAAKLSGKEQADLEKQQVDLLKKIADLQQKLVDAFDIEEVDNF